jgi:hypothetical protein
MVEPLLIASRLSHTKAIDLDSSSAKTPIERRGGFSGLALL